MSIFNTSLANESLQPIHAGCFQDEQSWKQDFAQAITSNQRFPSQEYPLYQVNYSQRALCIMAVVIAVLMIGAASLTSLSSFNATWSHTLLLAVLMPVVLLSGGLCVLYCLSKKIDVFAGTTINPFGRRLWAPMPIWGKVGDKWLNEQNYSYIDLSTLDETDSGIALTYHLPKEPSARCAICILSVCAIPWVVLFRMAYNIIRLFVIPFYILFRMVQQHLENRVSLSEDETFTFMDILRESARSLWDSLVAPFYGAGYMISLFYSLLDPLAGRVAIATLERDWNKDIIRSKSIWLFTSQKFFKLEGGGSRIGLGQHGFYLMGCVQPHSVVLFKHGRIVSVAGPSVQSFRKNQSHKFPSIMVSSVYKEFQNNPIKG